MQAPNCQLYYFDYYHGAAPYCQLLLTNNLLYGTTTEGGSNVTGTIFSFNTSNSGCTDLYNFPTGIQRVCLYQQYRIRALGRRGDVGQHPLWGDAHAQQRRFGNHLRFDPRRNCTGFALYLRHASIDGEIHAGDERTFTGSEERDGGRNFLGLAPATHWDLRGKLGGRLLGLFGGKARRCL